MALKVADLLVVITADPKGFNEATQRISQNIQKMGKKMSAVGSQMTTKVSLPLAAIGGVAAKMAMDFDDATTRMVSLVGVARDQVEAWKSSIHELARATGRTSNELAEAMFFITSAGLQGEAALAALEASAKAAAIGMGDTKSVAFATVSAMNAYGLSAEDAEKTVATLMMTVRKGNLEAASLAPTLGRVIPIASELGISFDQVGAAYAAMTRLGTNAEESATALSAIMSTLLKPSKQAKDTMAELGYSFDDLRTILAEDGLLAVLDLFKQELEHNEDGLVAVFKNVRAIRGAFNLLGKNAETTREIFRDLANTTERDLAVGFAVAGESAKVQFQQALAGLQVALISLGEEILPPLMEALTKLVDIINWGVDAFQNLTPFTKDLVLGFGGLLLVMGPLLTVLGFMTQNITFLVGGIRSLVAAQVAATGSTTTWTTVTSANVMALKGASAATIGLKAGLVGLAGAIGWMIGDYLRPFVNEWLGLNDLLGLTANKVSDIADVWMKDREAFEQNLANYNKMKETLGLTGAQWEIASEQTENNTQKLAANLEAVGQMIQKRKEEGTLLGENEEKMRTEQDIRDEVAEHVAKANEEYGTYLDSLKEEYGILSKEDVLKNLAERTKHYEDMKNAKLNEQQIQEAMGPLLEEDLELLKQMKVPLNELPDNTKKMLTNMGEARPLIKQQVDDLGMLGTQYESLAQRVALTMTDPNTGLAVTLKDSLAGGFGQGIEEGIAFGDQQLRTWVEEVSGVPVPVEIVVDDAKFMQWIDDLTNGRLPPGGGATP